MASVTHLSGGPTISVLQVANFTVFWGHTMLSAKKELLLGFVAVVGLLLASAGPVGATSLEFTSGDLVVSVEGNGVEGAASGPYTDNQAAPLTLFEFAPDGTSALNVAVVNAYFEVAAVLLDHGADPNAPDARGSPLHTLAWLREPGSDGGNGLGVRSFGPPLPAGNMSSLELAKALLDHGANPNARITLQERPFNKEGGTCRNPNLIHLGRHYLTFSGATPFYLAARNGDAPYMRLLAAHGADPKLPNVLGITPLIAASGLDYWEGESAGPYTGVSEAERLDAVKLALDLGNDINAAADFGDFKMEGDPSYLLLYYPLNMAQLAAKVPGDPRWSGSTALHAAVVSNQPSIVQYLVDHGAKLDAKTKTGWTPLMLAGGVFFANSKKDFPAAAAILKKSMAEHGLMAVSPGR